VVKYVGGFGEQAGWAVQLSTLDADKTIGFVLKYDNNLKAETIAFIQFAVLYTTHQGIRKIRIFNNAIRIIDKLSGIYIGIDSEALMNLQTKQSIFFALKTSVRSAKEQLCLQCINCLALYRKQVSPSSATGQLVIPDTMTYYPLLLLSVLKSQGFVAWEDSDLMQKVASLNDMSSCTLSHFITKIYTRMYSINQIMGSEEKWGSLNEDGVIIKAKNIPTSIEHILPDDAFLLVNSDYIYVFFTNLTNINIFQQVSNQMLYK
jgi:protein transport protein SEC24